ncbi:metal ABC transporter permease [bacterium]|nr:metal ABC transporter permease [bacterium]
MLEMLSLTFFQHALLISILIGIVFGLISFFIVLRRMAFLGAGIAHMAFGGVALGLLIGIHPLVTALIFCMAAAVSIGRTRRTGRLSMDAGIGIFFSFAMALGVLFISLKKAYTFDLTGYLFGNILGVTGADVAITLAVAVFFIPFILIFMQKLMFMSFDEPVAGVSGVPVATLEYLLLIILAFVIVIAMKVVGIILISALTVLPATYGMLFSNQYKKVILISVIYSVCMMIGGLLLSYMLDTPAGATIVVLGTSVYFLTLLIRQVRQ